MAPARVAGGVLECRNRHRESRERLGDLDPFALRPALGNDGVARQRDEFHRHQSHRGERAAVSGDPQRHGAKLTREHAQQRLGHGHGVTQAGKESEKGSKKVGEKPGRGAIATRAASRATVGSALSSTRRTGCTRFPTSFGEYL